MGISEKIIRIIQDKNISISEISKETGIPEEKFSDKDTVFSASEFLELCNYLNLQPQNIK